MCNAQDIPYLLALLLQGKVPYQNFLGKEFVGISAEPNIVTEGRKEGGTEGRIHPGLGIIKYNSKTMFLSWL